MSDGELTVLGPGRARFLLLLFWTDMLAHRVRRPCLPCFSASQTSLLTHTNSHHHPCRFKDLEAYLAHKEFSLENLLFLVWFQSYQRRFLALPAHVQARAVRPEAGVSDQWGNGKRRGWERVMGLAVDAGVIEEDERAVGGNKMKREGSASRAIGEKDATEYAVELGGEGEVEVRRVGFQKCAWSVLFRLDVHLARLTTWADYVFPSPLSFQDPRRTLVHVQPGRDRVFPALVLDRLLRLLDRDPVRKGPSTRAPLLKRQALALDLDGAPPDDLVRGRRRRRGPDAVQGGVQACVRDLPPPRSGQGVEPRGQGQGEGQEPAGGLYS